MWVVRVWEEQAPDGEEPLEWVRLASVPTSTLAQAWERVDWYRCRWSVEDYHQCLKSGCRIAHAMRNEMVPSSREVAELVIILTESLLLWYALAYFSFWFLARLPAWKKPGSDEGTRSPRMNPIRKEGVG